MHILLPILLVVLAQSPALGADPTIPPNTQVLYTTQAVGVQIYTCAAQPRGAPSWTLQAPEAALTLPGLGFPVARHSAGPTWTWFDGSSITGKVIARAPSADPASVPTLLLATTPVPGSSGVLNAVTYVRRSDAHGGAAPNKPCDPRQSTPLRVPYTATYTFYMPYTATPGTMTGSNGGADQTPK